VVGKPKVTQVLCGVRGLPDQVLAADVVSLIAEEEAEEEAVD
jgi:hypothetical protein